MRRFIVVMATYFWTFRQSSSLRNRSDIFDHQAVLLVVFIVYSLLCDRVTSEDKGPSSVAASSSSSATLRQINLTLYHVQSQTSSISIKWNWTMTSLPVEDDHDNKGNVIIVGSGNYRVEASSLISGVTVRGRPTNNTEFTITDLMIDTAYELCVTAGEELQLMPPWNVSKKACLQMKTIPVVRLDSVFVFLIVIGFVAASIAAGVICWKCAQRERVNDEGDAMINGDCSENPDAVDERPLLSDKDNKMDDEKSKGLEDQPPNDLMRKENTAAAAEGDDITKLY